MGVRDVRAAAVARRAGNKKPAKEADETGEKKTSPPVPSKDEDVDGGEKKE